MASEEHFDGIYQCRGASQARDYKMLMWSTENLKFDFQWLPGHPLLQPHLLKPSLYGPLTRKAQFACYDAETKSAWTMANLGGEPIIWFTFFSNICQEVWRARPALTSDRLCWIYLQVNPLKGKAYVIGL
jgi:hypothetical protein